MDKKTSQVIVVLGVISVVAVILAAVFLALFLSSTRGNSSSVRTVSTKPPHYGVFLMSGSQLAEMQQYRGAPDNIDNAQGIPVTEDVQPLIVVWLQNISLKYFFLLPAGNEYANPIEFDSAPKDNGILEIHPKEPQADGIYCFIQADPLGAPGQALTWCYRISRSPLSVNPGSGITNTISNISITPTSPADMTLNEKVYITFTYTTNNQAGVQIFAEPYTNGQQTPGIESSGSEIHPYGNGKGDYWFSIFQSGDVTIDHIRIQMMTPHWTASDPPQKLLLEKIIPVNYHFSNLPK